MEAPLKSLGLWLLMGVALSFGLIALAAYPVMNGASCQLNGDCISGNCVYGYCCGECGQPCLTPGDCCGDQGPLTCNNGKCSLPAVFLTTGQGYSTCSNTCDCVGGYCTSAYDGVDGVPLDPPNASYCIGCFSELQTALPNPSFVDPCAQCCNDHCLDWPTTTTRVCCDPIGAACTRYSDGGSGCCWDAGPTFLTCGPKGVCCVDNAANAPDCTAAGTSNVCCSGKCNYTTKLCTVCGGW
jgi:hypothetical protein